MGIAVSKGKRQERSPSVAHDFRMDWVTIGMGCGRERLEGWHGAGGIRTHGAPEGSPRFKRGAFNRSATAPDGAA
jgi:hypothetical protein